MPDDYESVMIEGNYLYKITADVISRTGEVGSGTLFLPVDHRSVALGINGLSNEVALEKREAIKVMAINYSAQKFLLVNRDGVIVDYGSALRPSFPSTAAKIDALIK